jgi:hypothetical protein
LPLAIALGFSQGLHSFILKRFPPLIAVPSSLLVALMVIPQTRTQPLSIHTHPRARVDTEDGQDKRPAPGRSHPH